MKNFFEWLNEHKILISDHEIDLNNLKDDETEALGL